MASVFDKADVKLVNMEKVRWACNVVKHIYYVLLISLKSTRFFLRFCRVVSSERGTVPSRYVLVVCNMV